jgi:hypothetical protein
MATGKVMLVVAWILTIASGQLVCYVLSACASVMAGLYWGIKIYKEVKAK